YAIYSGTAGYSNSPPSGTITQTVNPATLTVTANAQSKVYGQGDPTLSYGVSGLQFSDAAATVLTGGLSRMTGESVGSYAVTQGTLGANSNYTISFTSHDLAI